MAFSLEVCGVLTTGISDAQVVVVLLAMPSRIVHRSIYMHSACISIIYGPANLQRPKESRLPIIIHNNSQ